jgi:hypothetical protein
VSTLFRRKSANPTGTENASPVTSTPAESETESADSPVVHVAKAHTPGKGRATPKRSDGRRKPEPPPANRREAYKRLKEKQRAERAEAMAGMRAGDDRYLMARDKGPERALVRDIVDSRHTVGTWFFGSAFVLLLVTSVRQPALAFYGQLFWFVIALATIVDTVLICRKVKRLVRERFPKSQVRMGSLYFYAFMRAITFRRLRMPRTRVKFGDPI